MERLIGRFSTKNSLIHFYTLGLYFLFYLAAWKFRKSIFSFIISWVFFVTFLLHSFIRTHRHRHAFIFCHLFFGYFFFWSYSFSFSWLLLLLLKAKKKLVCSLFYWYIGISNDVVVVDILFPFTMISQIHFFSFCLFH